MAENDEEQDSIAIVEPEHFTREGEEIIRAEPQADTPFEGAFNKGIAKVNGVLDFLEGFDLSEESEEDE